MHCLINPLTTNGDYSCHRNLAACYELAQSVLKIGSVLAERVGQGEVGGSTAFTDSAWRLLQLGLVSTGWPVLLLSCTKSVENSPFTL